MLTLTCTQKGGLQRSYTVSVAEDARVQAVREALAPLARVKMPSILLFDGEDFLENHVRLSDYGIGDGATLLFEARLCGPLPADYNWATTGTLKVKQTRFAF